MELTHRITILARHGETLLNVEGRFRGRLDPPLSNAGNAQALRLGNALGADNCARILSSPRQRAQQTAQAIASNCNLTVDVDSRLDDVDYGAWTGLTSAEVAARWPNDFAVFMSAPDTTRFPEGESIAALADRVWDAFVAVRLSRGMALVTHDIVIRLLLCRVLGAPLATMHHLRIDLASTTGLLPVSTGASLEWMNRTSHLQNQKKEGSR
jgi:probable phosphoglycerate mutase